MVKLRAHQKQFANAIFLSAMLLTLSVKMPLEIRVFIAINLVCVALLSNRRGIEIGGAMLGTASMSFAIMVFFGDNPVGRIPALQAQEKVVLAYIYILILFGSFLHPVHHFSAYED